MVFSSQDSSKSYSAHISYLEIYNEVGYDLLDPRHEASRLEDLPLVPLFLPPSFPPSSLCDCCTEQAWGIAVSLRALCSTAHVMLLHVNPAKHSRLCQPG